MTDPRRERVMHLNSHHPLVGRVVIDAYRRRIGWVTGVVAHDEFSRPAWLTVTCGRRRRQDCEYLVPAHEAFVRNGDVYISYYRSTVRHSPALSQDTHLESVLETVHDYYGLPAPQRRMWPQLGQPAPLVAA